jgi:hypothetical protein
MGLGSGSRWLGLRPLAPGWEPSERATNGEPTEGATNGEPTEGATNGGSGERSTCSWEGEACWEGSSEEEAG